MLKMKMKIQIQIKQKQSESLMENFEVKRRPKGTHENREKKATPQIF